MGMNKEAEAKIIGQEESPASNLTIPEIASK
jgi:hypothetical protein